jgi:hypothetical protein
MMLNLKYTDVIVRQISVLVRFKSRVVSCSIRSKGWILRLDNLRSHTVSNYHDQV